MALLPGTRFAETAHRNKHILQLQQIEDAIEGLLCDLGTGGATRLSTVERLALNQLRRSLYGVSWRPRHTMNNDNIRENLRELLASIGRDGGLITPSVYDTAVVLHSEVFPGRIQQERVLEWLLGQQRADGGFGLSWVPRDRDLPTLAVLVALYPRRDSSARVRAAYDAALEFFRGQAEHWGDVLSDDIPVGLELLLPWLLEEARSLGIPVDPRPYHALFRLGDHRRALIRKVMPTAASAPTHSWEAWGTDPDPDILDASGGVGHSPAATAMWLRAARDRPDLADARTRARNYLVQCSECTETDVPGVVPTVWPINRFEQVWDLYALAVLGLLHDPYLRKEVSAQMLDLARAIGPEGLGMSDAFTADGDLTSTALATLAHAGTPGSLQALRRFERNGTFITYTAELQPSLTVNAHALHALISAGEVPAPPILQFLAQRQQADGRWLGDKWHSSWLYTTAQVGMCMLRAGQARSAREALTAVLHSQRPDGSWGSGEASTAAETAYAIHFLFSSRDVPALRARVDGALRIARRWLLANHVVGRNPGDILWIGKVLYGPLRVDRAWVWSALLATSGDRIAP